MRGSTERCGWSVGLSADGTTVSRRRCELLHINEAETVADCTKGVELNFWY
jgi:hypothetical protein